MADRLPPGQGALQNWNTPNTNKPEEYSSEFTVGGNKYANVTNVSTGQRQLYFVQPITGARGTPITTTNADGTISKGGNYDNFNQFNPGKLAAAEAASKQASVKLLSTPGISTPAEAAAIKNSKEFKSTSVGNNAATNAPTSDGTGTQNNTDELNRENVTIREGTRERYSDMKYPIDLASQVQDVIKFSILEYVPSLQGAPGRKRVVTLEGGSPIVEGSNRIGVITLPIPAGISDSNPVGWENDTLTMIQLEAAKLAKGFFEGGIDSAGKQLDNVGNQTQEGINTGEVKTAATGFLIGAAVERNIVQRAYGAINNNNVELLFSGPNLRTFSFTFLFYPREPNEARMVKRIIRAFKQAMSVKRSATSLLLKSPHTFAISYMTVGQGQHPYLNRFKECALTSCGVEYTPDGTYMTYDGPEKSMTAYRLSLTFQELEPIFDDEYGPDDNIGF